MAESHRARACTCSRRIRAQASCSHSIMLRTILLIGLLLSSVTGASAQVRPNSRWHQIETDHFRVVFEPGLESMAQHAAQRAEVHYAKLTAELGRPPKGKTD